MKTPFKDHFFIIAESTSPVYFFFFQMVIYAQAVAMVTVYRAAATCVPRLQ